MNIGDWLRNLGLERYEHAFRENDIDAEVLPSLTAKDLIGLGVASIGHRRRMLDAIAALRAGAPSGTALGPALGPSPEPEPSGAERRQLTVMFCDLVGSTALSAQLDPEDLREVIGAYHNCVAETVGGFDGYVAKYMGDGVLIYFGYPRAYENDAERAVMAALRLVGAVAALLPQSTVELACRVGIATGLVVVGDLLGSGEAQERGVVGETPNLAARLQGLAEPGTVIISDATRRLVGDLFEYRDLGAVAIRGLPEAVLVWQAIQPSAVESRFEALRARSLSPLVGREEEIELLLRRWSRAKEGEGQTVLLSGEPGIGKSRIVAAVQQRLHDEPHTRIQYFCSPHHRDSFLHPFAAQMERAAGFAREDAPAAKLDKLEELLAQSDENPAEATALIADLLGVPADGRYPPLPAEPQRRRQQTLAALLRQLDGLARGRAVLLIFEDAHWTDSTSLELLDLVVDRIRRLSVLLVVTFRPEFTPAWVGQAQVTALALSRLGSGEAASLVNAIGGGKSFPPEVLDRIVARTDGIPLFVEELTKTVLESGLLREEDGQYLADGPLPELAIPSSLQDSLMARLDRLGSVKEVAQTGAALGREFSYELMAAVARGTEEQLGDALDQLVAAGLVFRRGSPPNATYLFKHALVQDAAYSTLLRSSRQELHARIAKVLEQQFSEIGETQPELLAHHLTEAGLVDRAAEFWLKAGRHALARSAMKEAEALLRKGLGLVHNMADGVSRQEQELGLLICLGQALFATQGWAAPAVSEAYGRARELCRRLDQPQKLLPILYGQWINHAMRGEMDRAQQLAGELRQLGADSRDRFVGLMGRWSGGFTSLHLGDFADARVNFEDGIKLFDPVQRHQYLQLAPIDALVFLSTQLSLA